MYSRASRGVPKSSLADRKSTAANPAAASMAAQRSVLPEGKSAIGEMLRMQRTMGNQAVQAMFAERPVQRLEVPEEDERQRKAEAPVQRKAVQLAGESQEVGEETNQTGMPDYVKQKMEGAFAADFSNVRIHEGAGARDLGAQAYATGNDIHFAHGKFEPETEAGQQLLGHELAHVVQQREGRVQPTTAVNGMPVNDDPALEREADQLGAKAAQFSLPAQDRKPVQQKKAGSPSGGQSLSIQRQVAPAVAQLQEYTRIYDFLQAEAEKQGKSGLYAFFDSMSPLRKKYAIDLLMGSGATSLAEFKKKMHSYLHRLQNFSIKGAAQSINWDKFSEAIRAAKEKKGLDEGAGLTVSDGINYGSTALNAGMTAVGKAAGVENWTKSANLGLAAVTGLIGSAQGGYNLAKNYGQMSDSSLVQGIAETATGAMEAGKNTAGAVHGFAQQVGSGIAGSASTAAGALGVITGSAYLVTGGIGTMVHNRRMNKLEDVAGQASDENVKDVALTAKAVQNLHRNMSAVKMVQGALMVAGGAIALASGPAAPAGVIIAALGAALGGIGAIYKYFKTKSLKKEIVDRYLGVNKASDGKTAEEERTRLLQVHGFNTVDQCYDVLMDKYADYLYEHGVQKETAEALEILDGIGLQVKNENGVKRPTKEAIKKKLSF